MRGIFAWGCLVAVLFQPGISDIYLHTPPGSNNRVSGEAENVGNNNRLFDSQVELHFYTIIYMFVQCKKILIKGDPQYSSRNCSTDKESGTHAMESTDSRQSV